MVLGGFVIEACQDSGQESPEGDGLVVGDVKSLQREPETRNCFPAAWGAGHAWSSAAACWLSQDQYFEKPGAAPYLPTPVPSQLKNKVEIKPTQSAAFLVVLKSANVSQ